MEALLKQLTGAESLPPTRFLSASGVACSAAEWWSLVAAIARDATPVSGLRFAGCGLGCDHVRQLAEALSSNTTLEVLELPDNDISTVGARALANALSFHNVTLKSVDLSGNPCSAEVVSEIHTLLQRNRVLQKLPRTPPRTPVVSMGGTDPSVAAPPNAGEAAQPTTRMEDLPAATSTGSRRLNAAAFLVEKRMQSLEETGATLRSEVAHVRSSVSKIESWQTRTDKVGQQVVQVLSLVDSRSQALEARLAVMEGWRLGAERAWAEQSAVLSDMAAQLLEQQQRVLALEDKLQQQEQAQRQTLQQLARVSASASALPAPVPATAFASPAASSVASGALWDELRALGSRLALLEEHARGPGGSAPRAPPGMGLARSPEQQQAHGMCVAAEAGQEGRPALPVLQPLQQGLDSAADAHERSSLTSSPATATAAGAQACRTAASPQVLWHTNACAMSPDTRCSGSSTATPRSRAAPDTPPGSVCAPGGSRGILLYGVPAQLGGGGAQAPASGRAPAWRYLDAQESDYHGRSSLPCTPRGALSGTSGEDAAASPPSGKEAVELDGGDCMRHDQNAGPGGESNVAATAGAHGKERAAITAASGLHTLGPDSYRARGGHDRSGAPAGDGEKLAAAKVAAGTTSLTAKPQPVVRDVKGKRPAVVDKAVVHMQQLAAQPARKRWL